MVEEDFGTLTATPGYITATIIRELDASPEEVWRMLSEESERVKWLAPGSIDLRTGGRAILDFRDSYISVNSEVTACDPPGLLEFSWSGPGQPLRPIRFELDKSDAGCRLRLSVSIPDSEVVARSCAGWEAHVTMMQAALAGVSIKFPLDRFKACREDFDKQLANLMMSTVEVLKL